MFNINIRLNATNGSELYPDDYILTTERHVAAKEIEDFIYSFKDENEEYQISEVAEAIAEQFKGSIKCATFEPEVDVIV